MSSYHIGIDLGGTKTEIIILNSKQSIIFKERILTESQYGFDSVFKKIKYLFYPYL